MKRINLLLTFCFFATFSFSQDYNYNRQIGFDATGFISQFLLAGTSNSRSPYHFTYRKYGATKNTRIGFGADLDIQFTNERTSNSIDYRVGTERFHDFGKRWRAFYGWDFKFGLDVILNANSSNAVNVRLGGAPFAGLQFRLNERISFATETTYNIWLVNVFRRSETNTSLSTEYLPPLSVFVQYDFFRPEKVKKVN